MSAPLADLSAFRFGFGLPLPAGAPQSPDQMTRLLGGADLALHRWPAPTAAEVLALQAAAVAAQKAARQTPAGSDARKAFRRAIDEVTRQQELFLRLAIARALDSPDGLRERLQRFWQDHFTTLPKSADQRALTASRGDHAIRPAMTGRFADLLRAATLHPSMLIALDQTGSVGPNSRVGRKKQAGLNENLARELIELHTMGVGAGYSQTDVRELAKLLTGLGYERGQGMVFQSGRAEPGAETVLGTSYAGDGLEPVLAVLEDLALRPETARHIAHKLCVHFLSAQPDPDLVARMAARWHETGGALVPVISVLLLDPAARSPLRLKARQPFDFLIGALRALQISGAEVMALEDKGFRRLVTGPMAAMGQSWDRPVGPDGWKEDPEAWITPQGYAARIGWAMEMPARLPGRRRLPDARGFAAQALGSLAGDDMALAVGRSETAREGIGLVLASPAFNRW